MRNPISLENEDFGGLPQVGEVFDEKYRLEGILGVGGMGIVFAATHLRLEEKVALKLLLPQWASEPDIVERFMREGRASIKIRSEHVVRVLDVGIVLSQPYLVLEHLAGRDLEAILKQDGPFLIEAAVDCVLQACEALAEAHVAGIIHRDLKPANLFLTHRADGSPCLKVLDFGISKVLGAPQRLSGFHAHETLPNTVMGSPPYMAPEQLQSSRDADERSDIWSIGAILYELVVGKPPFDAETITELCARVLRDPPPPVTLARGEVHPELEAAILRCLEKDPDQRFANVAELARAFAGFGTASAIASAERISRIVDGGIESSGASLGRLSPTDSPSTRARLKHPSTKPSAAAILESIPPTPLRSSLPSYLLMCAGFLFVGGGIGWMYVHQVVAVNQAESRRPAAELPPALPSASAAFIAPGLASAAAPEAVQSLTTTSAVARTTAVSADAGTASAVVAAAVPSTVIAPAPPKPIESVPVGPAPLAPVATAPAAVAPVAAVRHVRRTRPASTAPPRSAGAPAVDDDDPYALDPTIPAVPLRPAVAPPAPAAPTDTNELFEGRK
jgi:serine/threonine protein kinase